MAESCPPSDQPTPQPSSSLLTLTSTSTTSSTLNKPICVILLGMAGSGKTSLCSRVCSQLSDNECTPYVINCDPACHQMPYTCNVDIRDTVNYKQVMKQYNLGPNGAIITSLNLFATQFDQIIKLIEKRSDQYKYVIFDTPGQIEVFTWSASGAIITEALASRFQTVIVYVMDCVRSENPVTFMSNMLYACSIVYKYKLPIIIALNKCDIKDSKYAIEWMRDWESFQNAIEKETSFMANLTRSMSLVLDTFYENLSAIGVSAMSGEGIDKFIASINDAALEYEREYRPQYERIKKEAQLAQQKFTDKNDNADNAKKEELITFGDLKTHNYDVEDDDELNQNEEEEEEDDDDEKKEYEDFKKFLAMQKAASNIQ